MKTAPILILAYNRPTMVRKLLNSLAPLAPSHIIFAVDGPKPQNQEDTLRVMETRKSIEQINWQAKIDTIFRPSNLGLRESVVDAVTHVTSNYGKAIVLEDDVVVGKHFLDYANQMLLRYEDEPRFAHINGYNVVPPNHLSGSIRDSRVTRYVESFAWATWHRSWKHYDTDLTWAGNCSIIDLAKHSGGLISAAKWKMNFADAKSERIDTWAYRWLATIWSNSWHVLSPNQNMVEYQGWIEGTHTLRKAKWKELPIPTSWAKDSELSCSIDLQPDCVADQWLGKTVYGESMRGLIEGFLVTNALRIRKKFNP